MLAAPRRHAFTLVELLVVIAIIGTLMGLLLPAVQSAREAGRRNTCMNNLKQMSMAVVTYDGKKQAIPGWRNALSGGLEVSWPTMILPELERRDVFNIWDAASTAPANASPVIPSFLCPTSPADADAFPAIGYAANGGSGLEAIFGTAAGVAQPKGDGVVFDAVGGSNVAGMYHAGARTNLDVITGRDGATNTLLFAERNGGMVTQPAWHGVVTPMTHGASKPARWTLGTSSPLVFLLPFFDYEDGSGTLETNVPRTLNQTTVASDLFRYPSSNHSGGVQVAFCDSHTAFITDSIATSVYAQLMTSGSSGGGGVSARVDNWSLPVLNAADY